ncbi:hypothetical protein [Salegentibacter mishustinae]|uniref:hypothetical protein n=1 Tax=Salegentibacter mishustinae TaxID=270918 RepID=UPI0024920554|nr:hypothetical protein [Salegentibacter mishustinae]
MIELLEVSKENNIYSSTVMCEIEEKETKLNFGINTSDFSRLKRILEFQPFQKSGFGKYRYFFALSYRNNSENDELCFMNVRVEQLKTHKEFEFELSKKYVSNILWLNEIKSLEDIAHLKTY